MPRLPALLRGALLLATALSPSLGHAGAPGDQPVLRIEAGAHSGTITRMATDAGGRYLVTASIDRTARVWDAGTGRLLRVLRPPIGDGDAGKLRAVAMSPDGTTIACGGATDVGEDTHSIYFFDASRGHLTRRIAGLPQPTRDLAWSPDGRLLAAGLQGGGLRVFRAHDGTAVGEDPAYTDHTISVHFDRGGKLATASLDGHLRLYRTAPDSVALIEKRAAPGGKQPTTVRFSPDGTRIAVGYYDQRRVDVVSAGDLTWLYTPDTRGIDQGYLNATGWSVDGRRLYGAGEYGVSGDRRIRVWSEAGRGPFTDLFAGRHTIFALTPLKDGAFAYGSFSGSWGTFDAGGRHIVEAKPGIAEFRDGRRIFAVSRDGAVVQFGFLEFGHGLARFDLAARRLAAAATPDTTLGATVTSARGLQLRNWDYNERPAFNGRLIPLEPHELSRAVAVAPDLQSFVLGADRGIRRFDREGKLLWRVPIHAVVRALAISGDGRLLVGAFADGTIRWHRLADGKELLALFPHPDRKRWVLWLPSGYYDASPGAEELVGWHLNRGKSQAADFYPVSRFRAAFYRPDVAAKVVATLDEAAAAKLAGESVGRQAARVEVAKALPPVVEIVAPSDGTVVSAAEIRMRFTVRTAADAPVTAVRARVNGQAVVPSDPATIGKAAGGGEVREVSVALAPPDNDVMLFAENRHGVSTPAVVRVVRPAAASPPGPDVLVMPRLYVLAVGVGDYRHGIPRLRYAVKDASDFAQAIAAQKGALYRDVQVKLVTDAAATRDEIADGLDWLQREVTAKDVGMLFLAGHGVNDPNGVYYFLPSNADPDKLKRTGVPFSEIRNTLAALAGKALFFVDTCHSGNVMGDRRAPAPDITGVVNELASAENGVVVFASSTGRQYSLESTAWQNGAFTKALIEGLQGSADVKRTGRVTHKMLDVYVAERVKELTHGKQTPVNPSPQGVPDFPIAVVKKPPR